MIVYTFIWLQRSSRKFSDEPFLNTTECKAFCNEHHGQLIDADLFDELKTEIEKEINDIEFIDKPRSDSEEQNYLLDLNYDYETKLWTNGVTKSVFNQSLWLSRTNFTPVQPILKDLLGKSN